MKKLKIAMFGHKRIPSREGGVEIVVEQLSTKMVKCGMQVTCFNRGGRFMYSGKKEQLKSYQGIIIKKCRQLILEELQPCQLHFLRHFARQ